MKFEKFLRTHSFSQTVRFSDVLEGKERVHWERMGSKQTRDQTGQN